MFPTPIADAQRCGTDEGGTVFGGVEGLQDLRLSFVPARRSRGGQDYDPVRRFQLYYTCFDCLRYGIDCLKSSLDCVIYVLTVLNTVLTVLNLPLTVLCVPSWRLQALRVARIPARRSYVRCVSV